MPSVVAQAIRQLARHAQKAAARRLAIPALLGAVVFLFAATALAKPYDFGASTDYRNLFDPDSGLGWINPRIIVWVLAQLHLLFGAFVLAVPMFVVIIEIMGLLSKDAEAARKYDDLAHEFCRLLTTAFSITSILGAIFTFACLGLYPKFMSYLVEVFGPTMYLYTFIFFGESFSLYIYYYGWGKIRGWSHAFIGLVLNAFGITLMLIANAWTTFMMAPAGIDKTGVVLNRTAAFWNFLLTPINIHRLIANLCLGGSVAGAYAAYKFLSTNDPVKRAHYDWMGYIGNFIAVLALLPLPFAGYYLGYEIYQYDQSLGIYMMGGVLSWLFIVQAVLIGALFLGANYYLWLGMDRIEGSERYRGWIKFLLGVITMGILVWATPRSIISIVTSAEIESMGGTDHPIIGKFGVMSAKNTAVNLIILATFLSFILYRRGNKVATVEWAPTGKMLQALAFGAAAASVVFIGVGGYVPSLWLESTKRVGMSPYQVMSVLACMVVVMVIDVLMFRGAKEIGRINWGKVSVRSQYCLIFLAVTFTWTMGLMGFARSSLRKEWHVYEVLKDTSPNAYTPALGYATAVVTVVVMLFFGLVGMVIWISNLGHAEHEEEHEEPKTAMERWLPRLAGLGAVGLVVALVAAASAMREKPLDQDELLTLRKQEKAQTARYDQVDKDKGTFQIPVQEAMDQVIKNPGYLRATDATDVLVDSGGSDPVLVNLGKNVAVIYRRAPKGEVQVATVDDKGALGPAPAANATPPALTDAIAAYKAAPEKGATAFTPASATRAGLLATLQGTGVMTAALGARAELEMPLRFFAPEDLPAGPSAAMTFLDNDTLLACLTLRSRGLVCNARYVGAVRLLDPALQGAALEAATAASRARAPRLTEDALARRQQMLHP